MYIHSCGTTLSNITGQMVPLKPLCTIKNWKLVKIICGLIKQQKLSTKSFYVAHSSHHRQHPTATYQLGHAITAFDSFT